MAGCADFANSDDCMDRTPPENGLLPGLLAANLGKIGHGSADGSIPTKGKVAGCAE